MFRFLATVLALHSASGLVLNGALPQQAAVMPAYGRSSSSACVMMAKKEGKKITVVLEREVEGLGAAGEVSAHDSDEKLLWPCFLRSCFPDALSLVRCALPPAYSTTPASCVALTNSANRFLVWTSAG